MSLEEKAPGLLPGPGLLPTPRPRLSETPAQQTPAAATAGGSRWRQRPLRTGHLSQGTLTAGVLGTAIRLFKVVLCFAFYSPTESAFCWLGTEERERK